LNVDQLIRNYDARAEPFEHWETQINNKYKVLQNETAKKVLKRYYRKIDVID